MERGKNNSAEFMLILCSCSCEQKRRIQRSIVDLLISENKYAECIIENHVDIQQLKEKVASREQ